MQKKEKETNSTPDVPTKAYFFIKGRYLLCSGFPLCLKAKYSMQSYIEWCGKIWMTINGQVTTWNEMITINKMSDQQNEVISKATLVSYHPKQTHSYFGSDMILKALHSYQNYISFFKKMTIKHDNF